MATTTQPAPIPQARGTSIGRELERVRLEHRARRMGFAIAALRDLSDARAKNGAVPPALRQAIAGFSQELSQVRQRIDKL